jgi:hypothetical protein
LIEDLRAAVVKRHPLLQESEIDRPIDNDALLSSLAVSKRSAYTDATWQSITSFYKQLRELFSGDLYELSHRVTNETDFAIKLRSNGSRAYFDTVGFKVVVNKSADIISAIEQLEQLSQRVLFRFNTYPFSKTEYLERIGPNSSTSYRAIHYYVLIDSVIAEIQLHTPNVNMWSKIHHRTLYKPAQTIDKADREGILALGEIANIVDLTGLLL